MDCSTLGPQSPRDEATTHSHTSNTHLLSLLLPQIPWAFLSLRTKRLLPGIVPLTSVSDYNGYKDPKDKSMDAFSRGRTVDESMYNDQRSKSTKNPCLAGQRRKASQESQFQSQMQQQDSGS